MRILVVDDDRELCTSIAKTLKSLRHDVCRAYNGKEAIEIEEYFRPDLIIMDINMPVMNGIQAVNQLINLDRVGKILILTESSIIKRELLSMGIKYYLIKPIHPDQFPTIISKIFKKSKRTWQTTT